MKRDIMYDDGVNVKIYAIRDIENEYDGHVYSYEQIRQMYPHIEFAPADICCDYLVQIYPEVGLAEGFGYKVGDRYELMTFDYFQYLEDGNSEDEYLDEKYYDCTIMYITRWRLILGSDDCDLKYDDGCGHLLCSGKDIKEIFPDFKGDDNKQYFSICMDKRFASEVF